MKLKTEWVHEWFKGSASIMYTVNDFDTGKVVSVTGKDVFVYLRDLEMNLIKLAVKIASKETDT